MHLWGPNCAVHDMDRAKRPPRGGSFWDPFWDTPCEEPWLPGVHLALGGSIWGSQMTLFGVPGTLFGVSWDVSFGGYPLRGVLELCLNMTWRGRLGPQITCFGGQITCFGGQITCFQAFSSISCPKLALGVVFRDPKTRDFGVRSEITLVLFGHVFGVLSRQIGVPPITLFGPFWQCRSLGVRGLVVRVK